MSEIEMNAGGTMEVVELKCLGIDPSYQRHLMQHHRRIAKDFDARACDPLKVGKRPDLSMWVIDGQQRREALLKMGYTHWRALVIESSGPEMEAHLFQIFGGGKGTVKPLNIYDVFRAQLKSNDLIAVAIQQTAEKYGFRFCTSNGKNSFYPNVRCVKQVYSLVKNNGVLPLDRAFQTSSKAWPEGNYSSSTMVILGLHNFWLYFPNADMERLVKMIGSSPAITYHQYGVEQIHLRNRMELRQIMLEKFVERYNKGLRNRLIVSEKITDLAIPSAE